MASRGEQPSSTTQDTSASPRCGARLTTPTRRCVAGEPGSPTRDPTDRDVPDPPNEFEGLESEPPHSDHGVHEQDSSGSDPAPDAP